MSAGPRVGIVADDLTSAADGAGPFVERGLECCVGFGGRVPARGDVRAVDTRSRVLPAAEAAAAITRAVEALAGADLLAKTIDSTLRGHGRVELAAALGASGREGLVLAPAFPAAGRTTVEGTQLVHGVEVTSTSYGLDPVHPVTSSWLDDLLDPAWGEPARSAAGEGWPEVGAHRVVLADARTQADLDLLVEEAPDPARWLWVGSPGLFQALAGHASGPRAPSPRMETLPRASEPCSVAVVIGSANRVSREQLRLLASHGIPVLGPGEQARRDEVLVAFRTAEGRSKDPSACLAELVARSGTWIREARPTVVLSAGGETTAALAAHLGWEELVLEGELAPGFPVGQVTAGPRLGCKAGGFGEAEALVSALRILRALPAT